MSSSPHDIFLMTCSIQFSHKQSGTGSGGGSWSLTPQPVSSSASLISKAMQAVGLANLLDRRWKTRADGTSQYNPRMTSVQKNKRMQEKGF